MSASAVTLPVEAPASPAVSTPAYPAHLAEHLVLEDGRGILLRPIRPADAEAFQAFVRGMSAHTRYSRYFTGLAQLPPGLLRRMTEVDHREHLCLIATADVYGVERVVGEARYVVDGGPTRADFAIAVDDDWQVAGIGSRLLRKLEGAARARGLTVLAGDVLASNRKALDFMRQRGFVTRANRGDPRLVKVEKTLAG